MKSNNNSIVQTTDFIAEIKQILSQARKRAYSAVNSTMVEAYWLVGKSIVEEEQQGEKRAEYGKQVLETLSKELTADLGKGFSLRNLRNFRSFYLTFPTLEQIRQTLSAELSWSHFQVIMRVPDEKARMYYLTEAAQQNWSIRTLDRNISTLYYQRLLSSQIKEPVEKEMREKTKEFQNDNFEFIKNPAVLEFLNLPANTGYTEAQLEQSLLDNIQSFLLELGKGFAFIARQQLIRTETSNFYIDLVFYNYILKCFVIIDLKTNRITHQDVGQLDMYVRMFDDLQKAENDNPTIGILLCTETDKTIAKYSVLNQNKQLFATKYMPYLPTEEELVAEIEREKLIFKQQHESGVE
jgi:predicted nuclease of restriction endonuclease-like (RecB) superfamily